MIDTIQIEIDEELKEKASKLFETLGLDLETALSMYIKRVVYEDDILIHTSKGENSDQFKNSVQRLIKSMNIPSDMTLDEINEEIEECRRELHNL